MPPAEPKHRADYLSVDVEELARRGGSWRGSVPFQAFERLRDAVPRGDAVDVDLAFRRDASGRPRVVGNCRAHVTVLCERCAEPVPVAVESAVDFRVAASEAEADRLLPAVDAVVADRGAANVAELIEDDLLLGLPGAACADAGACPRAPRLPDAPDAAPAAAPAAGPFAALATLKRAS